MLSRLSTRSLDVSGIGNEIRPTPPHSGPSSTSDMNILQTNFSFSSSQDASNFPCLPFLSLLFSSVLFYPFIHMRFIFVADFTFNLVAVCLMPSLFFSFRLFSFSSHCSAPMHLSDHKFSTFTIFPGALALSPRSCDVRCSTNHSNTEIKTESSERKVQRRNSENIFTSLFRWE